MEMGGITRFAVTPCSSQVDPSDQALFRAFISEGRHASMHYLERNDNLRFNPSELLAGAQSIICCAIPYYSPLPSTALPIARYAWGDDYHTALRNRLNIVVNQLQQTIGGEYRICIDSAPMRERYWAQKSRLGFIGLNGHLIVPDCGSYIFLAEILSTQSLPTGSTTPQPLPESCSHCMKCVNACPVQAITPDGSLDARKCLSYLTIEHRGEFPPHTDIASTLYGCDRCAQACPHNANPAQCTFAELMPRQSLLSLSLDDIIKMTPEQFSLTFRNSPIKRTKHQGLLRNALAICQTQHNDISQHNKLSHKKV